MTDLSLPLCRASDPITSFEAAESAQEFQHTHEELIMNSLTFIGRMCVDDIALMCDLQPHAVGKRIAKLEREGRIVWTGKYVKSNSSHRQREWRVA